MSRGKDILKPYKIITAGDMSLTSLTSLITDIRYLDNICIQLIFTGSPVGTFSVQGSADHQQDLQGNVQVAGTWDQITLSPAPIASAAGSILIDMFGLSFPYIRVVYTKSSGTGSLTAIISGKQT